MATSFPSGLDSLTNPSSGDSLSSPSHSAQHANVNDAVEALEAKVGVNGSAVTTSLDYKVAQQGLVLVKTQTIGTGVSSVTVTGAFSSTFQNYKITVSGGSCSADNPLYFQLSPAYGSQYYYSLIYASYAGGSPANANGANTTSIVYVGGGTDMTANFEVMNPNDSSRTTEVVGRCRYATVYGTVVGHIPIAAAYTDFIIGPASGTLSSGTIRVYGYNNG